MNRFRGQLGMSLVEATIILLVLMLLTGVIAPSIFDFVNDARRVKVKEDCEALGVTLARLVRDVGTCVMFDGRQQPTGPGCTRQNRVSLLVSDGPAVTTADISAGSDADVAFLAPNATTQLGNYKWNTADFDTMEHQFVTNSPLYPIPQNLSVLGSTGGVNTYPKPWFNYGWRGAYIQSPVSWDPWGKPYLINTLFLRVAIDAEAGRGEGQRSGGWSRTVFCLSAGANSLYETAFGGNPSNGQVVVAGVIRGGDDYFYPIQGNTK